MPIRYACRIAGGFTHSPNGPLTNCYLYLGRNSGTFYPRERGFPSAHPGAARGHAKRACLSLRFAPTARLVPSPDHPAARPDEDGARGRGLRLVDEAATAWGVTDRTDGKVVWAIVQVAPVRA